MFNFADYLVLKAVTQVNDSANILCFKKKLIYCYV